MSKSLRSMDKHEKLMAVARRKLQKVHGLGYWAAVDHDMAVKFGRKRGSK